MGGAGLEILKVLTSASSVVLCMSPIPSIYGVHRSQSTGDMMILPLALLLLTRHLWTLYGYITDDIFPLFSTYLFGEVLAVGYLAVYFKYTTQREYVFWVIVAHVAVMVVVTAYAVLGEYGYTNQKTSQVEDVVGYITVCGNIAMFASPFETIRRVLRTKSAATIPVALCAVGSLCNLLWIIYGSCTGDNFVLTSCSICFVVSTVQCVLYYVYPPPKITEKTNDTCELDLELTGVKSEHHRSSVQLESPVFEALHSPLAPLHR